MKERVNREDRVLHLVQCLFFTNCYPRMMGSCLIVWGLCMPQAMMSKGILELLPSLRVDSEWAYFLYPRIRGRVVMGLCGEIRLHVTCFVPSKQVPHGMG